MYFFLLPSMSLPESFLMDVWSATTRLGVGIISSSAYSGSAPSSVLVVDLFHPLFRTWRRSMKWLEQILRLLSSRVYPSSLRPRSLTRKERRTSMTWTVWWGRYNLISGGIHLLWARIKDLLYGVSFSLLLPLASVCLKVYRDFLYRNSYSSQLR